MNLIQTTTGKKKKKNENTFHHINQIQLFWISNVTAHSFTIRLNLQAFHLCFKCIELDKITVVKNFIISTNYTTRNIDNTIDIIFSTNTFLLQSRTPTPPPHPRKSESTNTNNKLTILCHNNSNNTKHFKYIWINWYIYSRISIISFSSTQEKLHLSIWPPPNNPSKFSIMTPHHWTNNAIKPYLIRSTQFTNSGT